MNGTCLEMTDINDFSSDNSPNSDTTQSIVIVAPAEFAGERLDKWLPIAAPELSRSRAKAIIEKGDVLLDDTAITSPKHKVIADGRYVILMPPPLDAEPLPEDIPLDVLFEDEHLIIINKPAGLVVHPAPGSTSGTLVNALLHHCAGQLPGIGGVARPGIVHRLDKDTSGVMVAAKTEFAHTGLSSLFQAHFMERAYLAVTRGAPRPLLGKIETRIARSTTDRKKMAVVRESRLSASAEWHGESEEDYEQKGKHAITNYKVLEQFGRIDATSGLPAATLTECRLETGRTHQIRVHMAHIGAPLLGDQTYGRYRGLKAHGSGPAFETATHACKEFKRQALHAAILGFEHPVTGENLRFEVEPPEDMLNLLAALRNLPT